MKRSHRRHKNPQLTEENKNTFFTKNSNPVMQTKSFFQKKGFTIGQPGDKYEKEADSMADAVVNNSSRKPSIQHKEITAIQRESLATPQEEEKLGTAEQRMEEDKLIQEKPEIPAMGDQEEEEMPVQQQGEKEEEMPLRTQNSEEEEEEPLQAMHQEEKEPQMQRSAQEEEKEPQMQRSAQEEEEPELQTQEPEEEEPPLQAKSEAPAHTAPTGISDKLKGSKGTGKSLSKETQTEMESKFRADFNNVNIHTGPQAVELNKQMHAQAFTHGQDVYFNSGKFNPETASGKHLLAHELTHVIQQSKANRGIQRQPKKKKTTRPKSEKFVYTVVGDKQLDAGGGNFYPDMESLKQALMKTKNNGNWTLTISIHGAEDAFGLSTSEVINGKGAYDKAKIKKLFDQPKFQEWRKSYGPKTINLASCQVGIELEQTFYSLVNKGKQRAIGLGKGCLLLINNQTITWNDKDIRARRQYEALEKSGQEHLVDQLVALNDKFGYFGKKVESSQLLTYYFDHQPQGGWAKQEVITSKMSYVPYLGRSGNSKFLRECTQGVGLGNRRPRVPPANSP